MMAGANAFLPKPVDLDQLLALIASLLNLTWTYGLMHVVSPEERDEEVPLVAPPQQEMEVLYRLARMGNMQDILRRANYLAELDERYRPFANQLRQSARDYQSKAIFNLVTRYMKREEVP